jgi:hypothetical protein
MKVIVYRFFLVTLTTKEIIIILLEEKTMASKRQLKQRIDLICEELFAECIAASLYGQNRDSAEALIYSTIKMRNNYIRRVSHPEPGMSAKVYYKDLKEKFAAQASEILDQLNNF